MILIFIHSLPVFIERMALFRGYTGISCQSSDPHEGVLVFLEFGFTVQRGEGGN
jgi:hypothetical protein